MPSGTITKGIGGFYYVSSEEGMYECKARGIFRKNELTPLTGDKVVFSVTDPILKKGSIDQILDRNTVLVRPAVANVDRLIAIISARSPDPDLLLLDKLLITAESKGIRTIICVNKTDLDENDIRVDLRESYSLAGYPVIETNSDEEKGFEELKSLLQGHISVFAGQSGVGKSTLLNRVMEALVMKTGGLSEKIGRGKHTTRHAELIELAGGGYIVDTPGFSSFELLGIEHQELYQYYPEFTAFTPNCRFTGCIHINEPDCAVKMAVENQQISKGRYNRYIELYSLLKQEYDMKYKKGNKKGIKSND